MARFSVPTLLFLFLVATAFAYPTTPSHDTSLTPAIHYRQTHNDFSCRSTTHPNPIILLHGLFGNYKQLNPLASFLQSNGYCTFSLNYGAYPLALTQDTYGIEPIDTSMPEIVDFIHEVKTKTGAKKIDLVGHSEGAFMTLYVPKFGGVSSIIQRIVAIAPPTHGTSVNDKFQIAFVLGGLSRDVVGVVLDLVGCGACDDLFQDGPAVAKLNDGPIVQKGNVATIIASRNDTFITPTGNAFVEEKGVANIYIQNFCPNDTVDHGGEPADGNVMNIVLNALHDEPRKGFECAAGT